MCTFITTILRYQNLVSDKGEVTINAAQKPLILIIMKKIQILETIVPPKDLLGEDLKRIRGGMQAADIKCKKDGVIKCKDGQLPPDKGGTIISIW